MSSLPKNQGESNEKTPPPEPAGHTPGPWAWVYAGDHPQHRRIGIEQADAPDAEVMYAMNDGSWTWIDVSDANARLIAAAPDLLASCIEQARLIEGLRNLLVFYRAGKRPTEKVLDAVQDPSAVEDRSRAAIAKAKGRAES